jgi:hypothetical protein
MSSLLQHSATANPFDSRTHADQHALWQILIARDVKAFVAANWSICENDFAHDRFEGIHAHASLDPTSWTLQYPTVDAYRNDWLEMAHTYRNVPLADIGHTDLLFKMQRFAKVEIASDRAIVCKQFRANERLTNGERYNVYAQSIYRLHRIDARWRIVGFIGYLPLETKHYELG